ncbi:MAG: bifunctional hydroxymethylpyrimidine kinase/phosphomethylpyrimidine kinase [Desulfobacterales bacterium]|jgi:hydroxymethylpyrimidine/phosphomethylpyrimidine kinase
MNEAEQNQKTPKQYRKVLTIAGSDSGGGAGIQADLKTFSAIGCYGMSVITALTAQNTRGVNGIHAVPPAFAVEQIDAVLSDIGADAIKIGMLYSAELIEAVAAALRRHGAQKIVLDPVMLAQSGDKLLQDEAVESIKAYLMPLAEVVTPNLPETVVLTGQSIRSRQDVESAARAIAVHGSRSILIKGGHGDDNQSSDLLYLAAKDRPVWLTAERIQTRNNHGTGCTLSSAIAAYLAKNFDIEPAVQKAKHYMNQAIAAGAAYTIGEGHGPVHHFFQWWE